MQEQSLQINTVHINKVPGYVNRSLKQNYITYQQIPGYVNRSLVCTIHDRRKTNHPAM